MTTDEPAKPQPDPRLAAARKLFADSLTQTLHYRTGSHEQPFGEWRMEPPKEEEEKLSP